MGPGAVGIQSLIYRRTIGAKTAPRSGTREAGRPRTAPADRAWVADHSYRRLVLQADSEHLCVCRCLLWLGGGPPLRNRTRG